MKLQRFRNLDWSLHDAELSRIVGCSRQYVGIARRKLKRKMVTNSDRKLANFKAAVKGLKSFRTKDLAVDCSKWSIAKYAKMVGFKLSRPRSGAGVKWVRA